MLPETLNPEQDLLAEVPSFKMYTSKAITLSTFFCRPLAGAYMLSQNFKEMGDYKKAKYTWVAFAGVMLFVVLSFFLPALSKIPSIVYSALFTYTAGYFARKYQGLILTEHVQAGGENYSTGRVVAVALICLVTILLFMVLVYLGLVYVWQPANV